MRTLICVYVVYVAVLVAVLWYAVRVSKPTDTDKDT